MENEGNERYTLRHSHLSLEREGSFFQKKEKKKKNSGKWRMRLEKQLNQENIVGNRLHV